MRHKKLYVGLPAFAFMIALSVQLYGAEPISGTITSDNWELPFIEVGSGAPVVAVHGAVSDHRIWDEYAKALSDKNQFLAYSRRYYGLAEWPEGEQSYDHSDHARDLITVIKSRYSEPVHLIARSSGSYAAVITAAKQPELVKSLSLWEPFVGNDLLPSIEVDNKTKTAMGEWGERWGPVVKEVRSGNMDEGVKKFIEHVYEMSSGEYELLPDNTRKIFRDNARTLSVLFSDQASTTDKVTCDFLKRIDKPTMVLLGAETHPGFSIMHSATADCIPNAKVVLIEGVNHNGASKKAAEMSEIIQRFISQQ